MGRPRGRAGRRWALEYLCPSVIGDVLAYRNSGHLTPSIAATMGPRPARPSRGSRASRGIRPLALENAERLQWREFAVG
jgi:hypothetical protein